MAAIILSEHANEPVDVARVVKMVAVHDIVEIDAGDTFCYDVAGMADKPEREQRAADRIFGILPTDQAAEIHALWNEFEARATPESRFANALDRLMPVLQNCASGGGSWREHKVSYEQVVDRNAPIDAGSHPLWNHVQGLIEEICAKGWPAS
jgi:putative hydrolase of HD superfamily